mgnify:CR=1 FL=1
MNKNDLIAAVAEKTGLTKAQAGEAVDASFEAVTETLKGGGEVRIIGFYIEFSHIVNGIRNK